MGKGTDLWNDSALINAFDAAMSSYKEMHGASITGDAHNVDKNGSNSSVSNSVLTVVAKGGNQIEPKDNNRDVENSIKETCSSSFNTPEATNVLFTQETDVSSNLLGSEFNLHISDHPSVDPKVDGDSAHHILDYNGLLKQYYELEQKKQNIAEQLWQGNYWNYRTPQVQGSTSQVQQTAICSGSELGSNNPCPWCMCHCSTATLTSITDCPMGSMLSGGHVCCPKLMLCCSGSQFQQEAGGITSAEGLANPIDVSKTLNVDEENQDGGNARSSMFEGKDLCSAGPMTDLTVVLNAWYRAGYHTGRYLLEQEQANTKSK